MSHYIGDIEITAITDIEPTTDRPSEEIKGLGVDPMVVEMEPELENLSIEFALISTIHSGDKSIEEQREDVRSLMDNDIEENSFDLQDWLGFLAVESVSAPMSGSSMIIEGTIEATYHPWPQYFPEEDPRE